MTKEQVQIIIGNIPIPIDDCYTVTEYQEAKAEAIKALEQQENRGIVALIEPSQKTTTLRQLIHPYEDCVSREQAKKEIIQWYRESLGNKPVDIDKPIQIIQDLPSATPTGTCKDCVNCGKDEFGHHCWKCHWCVMDNYKDMMEHFYCGDFEWREE